MKVSGFAFRVICAGLLIGGVALGVMLLVAGSKPSQAAPHASSSAVSNASTGSLPGLSDQLISAVDGTDVTITAVSSAVAASATVSESAATSQVLDVATPGSTVVAAQLVELTNSQYPNGDLVWAIQDVPSGGFYGAPGGPPDKNGPPPPRNFRIDFVDAQTGQWIEGVSGYSAALVSG